jgi:hypothetical protein
VKLRPVSILEFGGLAFWIALGGLRLLDVIFRPIMYQGFAANMYQEFSANMHH